MGRLLIPPVLLLAAFFVLAQQLAVPVLVDVSHGEITKGLDFWVNRTANPLAVVDFAELHILVSPGARLDPVLSRLNASRLAVFIYGDLSTVDLAKYKVVVLGQPPKPLTEAELAALKKWFDAGGKVLWCAADSDYPAQGSEESQVACNDIAEYLGSRLRVDYVSVEDPKHNAKAGYRVVGVVSPPPSLSFLGFMASRVLFHGPGAVAVVLPDGRWVPATSPEVGRHYNNIHVVAKTTENGVIVEHRTSADGKGRDGKAHKAGDQGVFALMALEFMPGGSVFIISGETPYGGYEPGVAPMYYGVQLDGPRFLRNVLLWATGNYRELATIIQLTASTESTQKELAKLGEQVGQVEKAVTEALRKEVNALQAKIDQLTAQLDSANRKIDELSRLLNAATTEANNARTMAFVGSLAALVLAIVAIVLATRKK
ncbi:MAG: ABC transporter [Pyrobaculum sp.]